MSLVSFHHLYGEQFNFCVYHKIRAGCRQNIRQSKSVLPNLFEFGEHILEKLKKNWEGVVVPGVVKSKDIINLL